MRINNISNVSFKKVYAVIGTKEQTQNVTQNCSNNKKDSKMLIYDATDLYKNSTSNGLLSTKAKNGKEITFFVTGKNIRDVMFMHHGWSTINGISQHIDKAYEIKDDKNAIKYICTHANNDWNNDTDEFTGK